MNRVTKSCSTPWRKGDRAAGDGRTRKAESQGIGHLKVQGS